MSEAGHVYNSNSRSCKFSCKRSEKTVIRRAIRILFFGERSDSENSNWLAVFNTIFLLRGHSELQSRFTSLITHNITVFRVKSGTLTLITLLSSIYLIDHHKVGPVRKLIRLQKPPSPRPTKTTPIWSPSAKLKILENSLCSKLNRFSYPK